MKSIKKYKKTVFEGYLDDKQEYYDYRTAAYTGDGNVIDTNHTGISFYDQFLDSSKLDYLHNKKNLKGEIVMMSPQEYYEECAHVIFRADIEKLKRERGVYDRHVIEKLHNVLNVYKRKLCMPMLNYAERGQEGLHRMLAIAELFGWDYKVPVLVVNWYDKERHDREEEEARQYKIETLVERSIDSALQYQFTDLEDLMIQLQLELTRHFKYEKDVYVPQNIDLKENDKGYILTFLNKEYPIERDQVKFIEDDLDDEVDIDDVEVDEDFLVRYFGKNWKTEYPHLKTTFNIKEAFRSVNPDKDIVIKVLEEYNNSYYEDCSDVMNAICEDLWTEHRIDANCSGRSLYVGNTRIAVIKIDREDWHLVKMKGYILYI